MTSPAPHRTEPGRTPDRRRRGMAVKAVGVAGFLFFLAKGLLWLSVPAFFTCFAAH